MVQAARDGQSLLRALSQRRFFRRRKEAQRDLANGADGTRRRGARRDRQRSRHRRAARGRGRDRSRAHQPSRNSRSSRSRTTSGCCSTSCPTRCTCWSTGASSRPAAPNSRARSKRKASTRSRNTRHDRPRRRNDQARFPDSFPGNQREEAGLSRLGFVVAKADSGPRRHGPGVPRPLREHPPRRVRDRRANDRRIRGRAPQGGGLRQRV